MFRFPFALILRIGARLGRGLRPFTLLLCVAAGVAFMPLAWQAIDETWGTPSPTSPAPATALGPEWTVLSHEAPIIRTVGSTYTLSACITYTTPAGVQERCRQLRLADGPATERQQDASRCYEQARIGDALPVCWR